MTNESYMFINLLGRRNIVAIYNFIKKNCKEDFSMQFL